MNKRKKHGDWLVMGILFASCIPLMIWDAVTSGENIWSLKALGAMVSAACGSAWMIISYIKENKAYDTSERQIRKQIKRIRRGEIRERDLPGYHPYERCVEDERQYAIYLLVRDYAEERAEEMFVEQYGRTPTEYGRGACHLLWRLKSQVLFNEFGIQWRSPADMNPTCNYD